MPTNELGMQGTHPANTVAHWLVTAVKTFATVVFKAVGWVVRLIVRGIRWLIRFLYGWFKNLNATGKILLITNILLVLLVIVLWLDLDLWNMFYGQE